MKSKKPIVAVAVLIVLAGVAVFVAYSRKAEPKGELLLSGNVEVTETDLGFKIPGRVVELGADEGASVKKGTVLAKLESSELRAVVAQSGAAVEEALTRQQELKAGSRTQEIEQARLNVKLQEAELERTKKDFERADLLYRNGAIPASRMDAARSAYDALTARHKTALEALSLVKEGPRQEDIVVAKHRSEQARAALGIARERLKDTVVQAPIDGVILKKNVEIGETVSAGIPVFTVGDLTRPWVKVYVKEDKLGHVKLGQKAKVTVDTFRDRAFEGTVTQIASEAEFTPKTVQTHEERVKLVFAVKVSVKNEKGELKPGMPADVRIATDR